MPEPSPARLATALSRLTEATADDGTRAAYASDSSNHRVLPQAVAFPRSGDEVAALLTWCTAEAVPVTPRGAGTNIAGSAIGPGVVLDCSRYLNRIVSVDHEARTARVEPGVVLSQLQRRAAPLGLRFGPDPSTHNRATLGGMIGTNACGSRSVAWGTTSDSVLDLEVVRPDGTASWLSAPPPQLLGDLTALRDRHLAAIRTDLGRFPRQISGYALQHLLPERFDLAKAYVGSEGTLGLVTQADLALVALPEHRRLIVAGFADIISAAAAAPRLAQGYVFTVEALDDLVVRAFDSLLGPEGRPDLPPGQAWLLIEVAGSRDDIEAAAPHVLATCRDVGATAVQVVDDPAHQQKLWSIRERGAGLATRAVDGGEAWPGWEDAAVPPANLAAYLTDFTTLMADHGRGGALFGHFGEGCVHVRLDHDLLTPAGRSAYREFTEAACDLVVRHGGSPSGEHGDGRARGELLRRVFGAELVGAFAEFKRAWDPQGVLNPGILVDPAALDEGLRQALARPHRENLAFAYADDHGDFGEAMRRCVGVGACRKDSGGGMCPSFRATRDERNSTRGRARMLFEMLDGHLAADGWQSQDVHDALDLCLGCKACASECPVSVDMATYKAEFLHQHHKSARRPLWHLTMGRLPQWLRVARLTPRLANAFAKLPGAARLAGAESRRPLPEIATTSPDVSRRPTSGSLGPATLWLDTFTRTFTPEAVGHALDLLAAAGYDVSVVGDSECCGLTLISTGQLDAARTSLSSAIAALDGREGPVIVLEPSCAATFVHDAPALLATDAARRVAAATSTLAASLAPSPLAFAPLDTTVVAQFHCHQRAILGTADDRAILDRLGVDLVSVDEGCCGLAGNFGYQPGHYDISVACAEEALLPALRAHPDAAVLADGLSCRFQCEQLAGRSPLHLATLLHGHLKR